MKTRVWLAASILIAAAVFLAACSSGKMTVLNPAAANKMVDRMPLSPRLDTLEGKTIFLVDIGWGGPQAAPSVYEEMRAWFTENMPSVKVELRKIKGSYMSDQPELWKEISENGDAAMIGISG